jgi:hypothetical protein
LLWHRRRRVHTIRFCTPAYADGAARLWLAAGVLRGATHAAPHGDLLAHGCRSVHWRTGPSSIRRARGSPSRSFICRARGSLPRSACTALPGRKRSKHGRRVAWHHGSSEPRERLVRGPHAADDHASGSPLATGADPGGQHPPGSSRRAAGGELPGEPADLPGWAVLGVLRPRHADRSGCSQRGSCGAGGELHHLHRSAVAAPLSSRPAAGSRARSARRRHRGGACGPGSGWLAQRVAAGLSCRSLIAEEALDRGVGDGGDRPLAAGRGHR